MPKTLDVLFLEHRKSVIHKIWYQIGIARLLYLRKGALKKVPSSQLSSILVKKELSSRYAPLVILVDIGARDRWYTQTLELFCGSVRALEKCYTYLRQNGRAALPQRARTFLRALRLFHIIFQRTSGNAGALQFCLVYDYYSEYY